MTDLQEQAAALAGAQETLSVGPVQMARLMGTPYDTYKNWLNGQKRMPAVGKRCLELVLATEGKA